MGLRDLSINTSYESSSEKSQLLDTFYIPVLENSIKYYRIAGFFSSSALSVAAEGIEGLVKNNGKMYLLVSPELSEQDYQIMKEHGSLNDNCEIFKNFSTINPDDNLKALAWMLDSGHLEIKIVVGIKSKYSLFHQKIGIFTDAKGDMLSFSGSINETAQAWINNIEEFKVFRSWEPGQVEYLTSDLKKFLLYWKNEKKDIACVYSIPESVKEKIIQIKPANIWDLNIMRRYNADKKINQKEISLFSHQRKAVNAWIQNDYRLLMEMATGTGKTRTAIGCLVEKLKEMKESESILVIIATPQNTLSRQWRTELSNLDVSVDKEAIIDGSNNKWRKELELMLFDLREEQIKTAIIFTTHDTASSDKFIDIIKKCKDNTKILFIGDEVHAIGSQKQRKALLPEYDYRIGLSATPERMYDKEGTSLIRDYFGKKSFEFTIADALNTINPITGRPFLNRFEYYPVFVDLTEEENKKYRKLTQQIIILKNKKDYDPDELQILYTRRANIGKNAQNKIEALDTLLDKLDPENIEDTILFVTDKQINQALTLLSDKKIKRAKITEQESASKIVNKQGETERQAIIEQFKSHQIQVVLGIKCLDEGIDIPNARIAILMASSTNPREFVQRVGRVIRQAPNKATSIIYDFIVVPDNLSRSGLLEKESRRAKYIAINAVNYNHVKALFLQRGVDINAD
ncbi:DEAD/DEAH box helicase family protein [Megasphaera hexanoica]|uniref:DEAD/DEAH box helicase family protein n=1 Tax=Megasphaera hexanoica TaxID=1675036 RepID=A0A848BPV3_9FIRM|nr:DEAD/DEAH box helicase family protein [Megasphaera hexanoica]NME28361.1 DEAD/DEAH box helicase family protein [Megasphaera hexanoica]